MKELGVYYVKFMSLNLNTATLRIGLLYAIFQKHLMRCSLVEIKFKSCQNFWQWLTFQKEEGENGTRSVKRLIRFSETTKGFRFSNPKTCQLSTCRNVHIFQKESKRNNLNLL